MYASTTESEVAWNSWWIDTAVSPAGSPAKVVIIGTISAAKIEPMRYVSQRPQPTFGPMNPTSTPPIAATTR